MSEVINNRLRTTAWPRAPGAALSSVCGRCYLQFTSQHIQRPDFRSGVAVSV